MLFPKNRDGAASAEGGGPEEEFLSSEDEARTIETVKILIAMLYTIKNHLRAEWGVALSFGTSITEASYNFSLLRS